MDLIVSMKGEAHLGEARWGDRLMRCALGAGGILAHKREGDHATPAGIFALRRVLYRPDRLAPPPTGLHALALSLKAKGLSL